VSYRKPWGLATGRSAKGSGKKPTDLPERRLDNFRVADNPGVRETTLFLITTGKKKSAAATICGCPPFEIGLDMSPDSNGTLPSTVDGTNKIKGA
jgi:hypothetical protein